MISFDVFGLDEENEDVEQSIYFNSQKVSKWFQEGHRLQIWIRLIKLATWLATKWRHINPLKAGM